MTFYTKRDSFLLVLFSSNSFLFVISLIVVLTTVPFNQWFKWIGWGLLVGALLSWLAAGWFISYTFNKESVLIRKGLFIKQIQYNQLIKAKEVYYRLPDLLTGERALSSKDGLALYYQTKVGMKTIKLSPKDKVAFVIELKKSVPKIEIEYLNKK
ncbi:PH domain-containing protein [Carnobacterium iners]|uniref:PH domain-containing protein n=1 Tax=Carnobacterium iners TaxID=1073423 RepID=A0A1X7NSS1_9LACT|nr:PH domain-containing protein [Carnobacterium iners]SEK88805.1 PH domain-containing protein [Carnobacterium iners]SMH40804.1 PH domain-containing protein [Carnobacterium iners]